MTGVYTTPVVVCGGILVLAAIFHQMMACCSKPRTQNSTVTYWINGRSEQRCHLLNARPFVVFPARSRERSQLPLPGRFLRRRWFTLCITIEAETRIAKQYKCHYCCVCKNYRITNEGDGGWKKKRSVCIVSRMKGRSRACGKNWTRFLASYSTINRFLLVDWHTLTTGLQKCL